MSEAGAPFEFQIVSGTPTDAELAALTVVLVAAGGSAPPVSPPAPVRGRWNDPARAVRRHHAPGPGGWRAAR